MITDFIGRAKKLDDVDLPRIAHEIRVGEDELHAFMEVETRGYGFYKSGRPVILFEPHIFNRMLAKQPTKQAEARRRRLAAPRWGQIKYASGEAGNYDRLKRAMTIDSEAALKSCSWGFSQVMGFNHAMIGYPTAEAMVRAFMDDEEKHIEAMVDFIVAAGIDDEMRDLAALTRPTRPEDCVPIVRVYNGSGYAKNRYHIKFAQAHNKWRGIPDTPWKPGDPEPDEPKTVHPKPSEPKPDQEPKPPQPEVDPFEAISNFFKAIFAFLKRNEKAKGK